MMTATAIAAAVRDGTRSATECVDEALARAADAARLNAFRELHEADARARARAIDTAVRAGDDPGPLAGVPIAVKDNIATTYGTTACGSRMLADYRSPYTATAVERAERAGAIVIGRTNCDEFAMGSSTEHCAFGPTRNPHDEACVPGGSSGGSAVAVAAETVPLALGSDTGGSIRQPAALTGTIGIKPSYGRVSRHGLVAFGSSLDQIGPIASTARDAALLLQVIAGRDPLDSTSVGDDVPDLAAAAAPGRLDGLRVGRVADHFGSANDTGVTAAVERGLERLRTLGAEVVPVELPLTELAIATYYVIAPAEASSNLARFDGIRYGRRARAEAGMTLEDIYARSRAEGFGPEVRRRILLGTYVLSAGYHDAYYRRAMQVRRLIADEFARVFAQCDAVVGPTSPTAAFEIGAHADPLAMYQCDVYTVSANIAGICAASVPCGTAATARGTELPVGLHVQCPAFAEARLVRIIAAFEGTGP